MKKPLLWSLLLLSAPALAQKKADVRINANEAEKKVEVLVDGQPFTAYFYPGESVLKKPVLYPIRTAAGTAVTRGWPFDPRPGERVDHPHHVGAWFNYGDVNEHDFWNNSNDIDKSHKGPFGTIVHTGVKSVKSGKGEGSLTVTADWRANDGRPMLGETTTFVFRAEGSRRIIDRLTTLTANEDVLFRDNKEGMFAIRLARQLEHPSTKPEVYTDASGVATKVPVLNNEGVTGKYHSSEGVEGEDVWGKRAKWMNLGGKIGTETVSLAILDHPQNVGYPSYWHSRGYGLYAVNNLGWKAMSNGKEELNYKLPKGQSVTFRHRVVVDSKALSDADLNALHTDFARVK
jgi:hypothetical protein